MWIEHKYIKEKMVEYREYQVNLAKKALDLNTLILLPTGLGKTTIALLIIADMLMRSNKRILIMAPTRVLVHQHYQFLKRHLNIVDIGIITGESNKVERRNIWNNSIICATPQVVQNDLEHLIIKPQEFSLIIFDEAHKAIGDHAYTKIATLLKEHARLIGLTATIPSDQAKAKEIINNLAIIKIEDRDENSPDVKPYIHDTKIEYITVETPLLMQKIREYLNRAIDSRLQTLKRVGLIYKGNISELVKVKEHDIIKNDKKIAAVLFATIRLYHALNILDTQSLSAFIKFCDRMKQKKMLGMYSLLIDNNFKNAYEIARGAVMSNIEHPKISKLCEIIEKEEGKILVFTSYRDNVEVLYNILANKVKVGYLIGKAGEDGLKEREQVNTVQEFREGKIKVLIATQVGEEGLDISECNLVIFYDNVPSVIRLIQRKGRTGRSSTGRVIMLVTKGTLDEIYSVLSKRRLSFTKNVIKKIKNTKGILDY